MTQTQLDLPQVSFGHYLELLKRRRWQVIPLSLLGLLIGGIVGFLIPRYYVAQIVLEHSRAPVEELERPNEDAYAGVVDNAIQTLPFAAAGTMKKLGWSEAMEQDAYLRSESERAVEGRIHVLDTNPGKGRPFARLVVTYRDLDGKRAADFLNTLVDTWIEEQLEEMRDRTVAAHQYAIERYSAALREYDGLNEQLMHLARQYGFERELSEATQREQLRIREQQRQARASELIETEARVAALTTAVAAVLERLDRTPDTLEAGTADIASRLPEGPARTLYLELEALKNSLENIMQPGHPNRRSAELKVALLEARLQAMLGVGTGEFTNPLVKELQDDLAKNRTELAAAQQKLERLRTTIAEETAGEVQRLAAEADWIAKNRGLLEASTKVTEARQAIEVANQAISDLQQASPIKRRNPATVPPRPTDPNVFLVAGLGCLIGLGVSIGLILLLDVLQTTLKTIEDVERALSVPVLGGMDHLETAEERVRTVSGRRRASLLAGAFLFGAVVVVTIYYVDPARLPPFARDLLSMVLGD